MKKKRKSRLGDIAARIVNVRAWFDWDRVKSFTLYLGHGFQRIFSPDIETKTESFDAAMKRLNISDEALLVKQKSLLRLSVLMLFMAIAVFIYMWYQLFFGSFIAAIVSLVVTLLALVLAFRYHFWYFQMKSRKLGCTFDEWLRQGLMGEKV